MGTGTELVEKLYSLNSSEKIKGRSGPHRMGIGFKKGWAGLETLKDGGSKDRTSEAKEI